MLAEADAGGGGEGGECLGGVPEAEGVEVGAEGYVVGGVCVDGLIDHDCIKVSELLEVFLFVCKVDIMEVLQ